MFWLLETMHDSSFITLLFGIDYHNLNHEIIEFYFTDFSTAC